jgi:hypothetical protein
MRTSNENEATLRAHQRLQIIGSLIAKTAELKDVVNCIKILSAVTQACALTGIDIRIDMESDEDIAKTSIDVRLNAVRNHQLKLIYRELKDGELHNAYRLTELYNFIFEHGIFDGKEANDEKNE